MGGDKASIIAAEIDAAATNDLKKCAKEFPGLRTAIDDFLIQLKLVADGELT